MNRLDQNMGGELDCKHATKPIAHSEKGLEISLVVYPGGTRSVLGRFVFPSRKTQIETRNRVPCTGAQTCAQGEPSQSVSLNLMEIYSEHDDASRGRVFIIQEKPSLK